MSETRKETLRRLFTANNLVAEDVYKHQHYTIITRQGIDKIQANSSISINYDVVECSPNFCVVKATATSTDGKKTIQTFGSALKGQGFKDGNTSGNDYVYDANGNMTKDLNKGISAISYNHLNLPTYISFYPSQYASIRYVYSADGTKLKKTVAGYGIPSTTTEYAGNYIYENNTIQSTDDFIFGQACS